MSEFDDLVGKEFDFYGVAANEFKLDDTVWEAVEDEEDGYRSCLGCIKAVETTAGPFFQTPIARVFLLKWNKGDFEGFVLRDTKDCHLWLEIGTDHGDSYYPFFVFAYSPKEAPNK